MFVRYDVVSWQDRRRCYFMSKHSSWENAVQRLSYYRDHRSVIAGEFFFIFPLTKQDLEIRILEDYSSL